MTTQAQSRTRSRRRRSHGQEAWQTCPVRHTRDRKYSQPRWSHEKHMFCTMRTGVRSLLRYCSGLGTSSHRAPSICRRRCCLFARRGRSVCSAHTGSICTSPEQSLSVRPATGMSHPRSSCQCGTELSHCRPGGSWQSSPCPSLQRSCKGRDALRRAPLSTLRTVLPPRPAAAGARMTPAAASARSRAYHVLQGKRKRSQMAKEETVTD